MSFWSPESIKAAVGGTWLARPEAHELDGVSTDTRTVRVGALFVALRGEKFDANTMVGQAAEGGAAMAIVDRPEALPSPLPARLGVLHVQDTGVALLRLAAAYRKTLDGTRVIAVTGSNGKTTTTRLVASVLAQGLRGTASMKSFNNRVGVPLTILSARRGDQYLVCEVGTNAIGEIGELAPVISPDIVVVTSIGREHLEGLGGIEGSVSEALSLVQAIRPGGLAVVNADAPLLLPAVRSLASAGAKTRQAWGVLTFGQCEDAELRITGVEQGPGGLKFTLNDRTVHTVHLLGRHNASNAAAAIGVGRRMGVESAAIDMGLRVAEGPEMRLERVSAGGIHFINDAYNANPESVLAALDVFADATRGHPGRRVVILGDMLELGEAGSAAHREIGDAVARLPGVDLAVFVGPLSAHAAERVRPAWGQDRVVHVPPLDPAGAQRVAAMLREGDTVLLKGSRGMAIERVLKAVSAQAGTAMPQGQENGRARRTPAQSAT